MKAKDVMTRHVVTVGPGHGIRHAATRMIENRISGLPVIDDDGRLVGILTEGDLICRAELGFSRAASDRDEGDGQGEAFARAYVRSESWRVSDVMSRDVLTVTEETTLARISEIMTSSGFNRLPVVEADRLVGIVSRSDLLRVVATADHDQTATGDTAIACAVAARLDADLDLDPATVRLIVTNGDVELIGTVRTLSEREAARVAAEGVRGVASVTNRLAVSKGCRKGKPAGAARDERP